MQLPIYTFSKALEQLRVRARVIIVFQQFKTIWWLEIRIPHSALSGTLTQLLCMHETQLQHIGPQFCENFLVEKA